ncbi:MAG: ribonuclease HII [Bacteroidetes bacterium]|nr:MAG: ribonuclease HII [Bacteroidota bacterium]
MGKLKSYYREGVLEAGCDEAGRGCMAGPVVAASVILPPDFKHPDLNDSKQLSEAKRAKLRPLIEKEALAWKVVFAEVEQIDQINILNASIWAMQQAAIQLKPRPEFLLIDGNRFHTCEIPHECFVKGDGRFQSIAAASILAKTHRDEYMEQLSPQFEVYNWKKNKGYPTREHRDAILKYGLCEHHRKTFRLKEMDQLSLDF